MRLWGGGGVCFSSGGVNPRFARDGRLLPSTPRAVHGREPARAFASA